MIARGFGSTNTRRRRKLDCIGAMLITAVAGCGDDFPHPIGPDPTPDLTWQLSATGPVRSIWGDPSGEVFAVCRQGILHYDGSTWSNTSLPDEVLDIWGSSAEDVFAVGWNWSSATGTHGSIFHYDGKVWTAMTTPTSQVLHAVWGSAANDVYAVGESATILH